MSFHDSSHTGISIFINKQNAAFALPLVSICITYAYFKLLPVRWSIPLILAGVSGTWLIRKIQKRTVQKREEKIATMDDDVLKELAADELAADELATQKAAKKVRKEQDKVRLRIVAEKKAAAAAHQTHSSSSGKGGKKGKKENEEDVEDEHDFQTLASYSTKSKKK